MRATPKSEQTRALILEAAVDVLGERGYHGMTLARIADAAGVTRGAVQYYFMRTEDVILALAGHVTRRTWEGFESRATRPPEGRDLVEFAIDLVANPELDRYRVARLELVAAARTTPALRKALEAEAGHVETRAKAFTAMLFGDPRLGDLPPFRAARDLTFLVSDWLSVQIFPDRREERIADVRAALRVALHALWRLPGLDVDAAAVRPRLRVPAPSRPTPKE